MSRLKLFLPTTNYQLRTRKVAVVFISPKQRQKMFFMGITVMLLLFLIVIFLGIFFSEPEEATVSLVFNRPKVVIDMSIFDADQFRDLRPFPEMQTQYSYRAVSKNNKVQTGFIFADSLEDARKIITNMGLAITDIKEAEIGRDNPFVPYYQTSTQSQIAK